MNLGVEGSFSNLDENAAPLLGSDVHLQGLQNFEGLRLGGLKALSDDPRVEAFTDVEFGLLQELADQQNGGGCAVASHVIL